MDFDMISFDPLLEGRVKFEFKHSNNRIRFKSNLEYKILNFKHTLEFL
jgi:hypothetical protein